MKQNREKQSEIIFYTTPQGNIRVEALYQGETIWLTQKKMAELFDVEIPAISKHLKNIFETSELQEKSVISTLETTGPDGKKYKVKYYNLDAIIAVGYRVNSQKATHFRIWATKTLKEFIIKGFVLDSERLKNGEYFNKDYFDELLEKIREIRASERRFYQKITDIYALSVDYDKTAQVTKDFFATVQNKLHWAITGKTAAETIYLQVDKNKHNMGLTTWKNSPFGKILKSDTLIAKNYLNKQHIKELELVVSAYLDLAENRANRHIIMKMNDWILFLNQFLELSNYPILKDKGKVTQLKAQLKAIEEYKKFRVNQDRQYLSDFDKETKKILNKKSTGSISG
ncbi:virulence RhuM family protein [Patescibacteria group bacterium]|nr:virulence RhuM family protein [Patescibacteria group bacterium]